VCSAAGIVDNGIGPVVCIGQATGAGGANVWNSDDLRAALAAAKSPLPKLLDGVHFTVAIRRAVRSGSADGTLIEDAGVSGQSYEMTHDDIFKSNRDLIEHCGELLAAMPRTRMNVERRGGIVTVETVGIEQIDLYIDGHPAGIPIKLTRDGTRRLRVPSDATDVEVVGFAGGVTLQRRRIAGTSHS